MDERTCRATVMPGVPHEPARLSQDGWRVHRACGEVVAQLEAVVGQVTDLEHEGDEVEGQEDDAGTDEADEDVEFEVGLLPVRPWQRQVYEEPGYALVDNV